MCLCSCKICRLLDKRCYPVRTVTAYSSRLLCLAFYQTSVSFDPFLYESRGRDMKLNACFRGSLFFFHVMVSALFYLSCSKSKVILFL